MRDRADAAARGELPDLTPTRAGTTHLSYYVWDGPFMDSGVVPAGYELNVPAHAAAGICRRTA